MRIDHDAVSLTLLDVDSGVFASEPVRDYLSAVDVSVQRLAVESAAEAKQTSAASPGVVVSQYDLADGDGISVLSHYRDANPDALTILVSADSDPDLVERAYDAGIDRFVHDTGPEKHRVVEHHLRERFGDGAREAGTPHTTRHMEALSSATPDAIVSIDESSTIRYANPAVADVFGYDPDELVGEPLTALMPDDLAASHHEGIQRYLRTGERTLDWDAIELPGQHADGHRIPLSISFAEFTTGTDRYFTGIIRDVTERKRLEAERALYRETTQRILQADSFEDGLETALDAVGSAMDWQYGEAWVQTENEHFERVSEAYATSDAAASFQDATSPVSFTRDDGLVGRVWDSGAAEWLTDVTDDAGFEREAEAVSAGLRAALAVPIVTDGTVVAVMVFLLAESREPDEEMLEATRTIAADLGRLMGRLRAETALREERSLKDRILETSPVGIAIIDEDGTFRYLNDRATEILAIDGYNGPLTEADLSLEPLTFDGELIDDDRRPYQRVVEDGETLSGQASVEIDGETRWLSVRGAPLRGENGEATSGVFSLQNVTARKRRERQLQRYEAVVETVGDGVYALDDQERFVLVNDAYTDLLGYDRDELLGRPASDVIDPGVTDVARDLQGEIRDTGSEQATLETTLETADGETVPVEARISLFELADGRHGRVGIVRDIAERKRREERLATLNEIGQALTVAETETEVADIVVSGAREMLGLPLVTLEYYDEETGQLTRGAATAPLEDLVGSDPLFASEWGVPWKVFTESDGRVIGDLSAEPSLDADETPLESAVLLDVGSHGVFTAGSTEADAFTETDVMVARILVANATAALDRVDREQSLKEKNERLADRNESLERLSRLNRVIRDLTQELTQASTRDEIETAVCSELVDSEPYVFAWIGEQRAASDEIVPRASAGRGDGYLDTITVTTGDEQTGSGPTGTAFRSREPAVQNSLQTEPPFESWRTQALQRGYRASIAVPLAYRDTVYGILHLYADEPGVFDEMEVAVLGELGEMVGYAINAFERKKALVSDGAVELSFHLDDESIPALAFASQTDSTFEFEELVEHGDGDLRAFFTVSDADPEQVSEFADRIPAIEQVSLLAETEEGGRYEALVSENGFLSQLLSYGVHPTVVTAGADGGTVTVEIPQSGDVQSFVRMFTGQYESAELVSRKEYDRPVQTMAEFEAHYRDRLTERQLEVLKTAYFSGFFEWPRETSGKELADLLDIAQPTVSRHIRTGERKLFSQVFEE
ncbi:PAS domain S-box protein [Haloarcula salina]|uniref:PAS domain S-box protein n=1 Tax=Haloarcula salina TaxID=1429914 RepID=A0AA41G3J0_9EURY|nr:PAS domain S-box protein [Haloarcula salina]MBV0902793.1 PAS domain S-box protein [Haloarcula salina]